MEIVGLARDVTMTLLGDLSSCRQIKFIKTMDGLEILKTHICIYQEVRDLKYFRQV